MQYNWSAHLVAKRSASACQCLCAGLAWYISGSSTQEPKKSAAYVVGLWFCLCFKCSTISQCVQLRISNLHLVVHITVLNLTTTYIIFHTFHWNVEENIFLYSFNNSTLRFDIIFKPQHSRNNFLVNEKEKVRPNFGYESFDLGSTSTWRRVKFWIGICFDFFHCTCLE